MSRYSRAREDSQRMIPGYNHSVKHRGSVFHVQTEDLGLHNPVISTHLFLGGNVVASRRTSYAEIAGSVDAESRVRQLMQEQHKEMLRQLVRGAYDGAPVAAAPAYQPGELARGPSEGAPPEVEPQQRAGPSPSRQGPTARPHPPVPAAAAEASPPVLPRVSRPAPPPVLIPEIEDEDLMSDRRLDEVILAYLAESPGTKRGE